jgi:hypothetical protein
MRWQVIILLVFISFPTLSLAADGVLFLSPERGTYGIGDVFEVEVRANTDGEAANAAEADIVFNPAALSVVAISTEGSVLSLWPTAPTYSNAKGTIRFSGTASGSFRSDNATLIRIQFRAESNVPGDVHLDSGALLLNDARATNIIATMRSGLYTVTARRTPPAPDSASPVETEVIATSTIETPEVKGAAIQIPVISGYDDRVSIGGRIILQGSGTPNTRLAIFLQHEDDAPYESSVLTTSEGSFTFVSSEPAREGVYHAWAEARSVEEKFASDKVVIVARSDGFAAAAASVGAMLTYALPFVLLLIAAGVSLGYLYNRRAATRV